MHPAQSSPSWAAPMAIWRRSRAASPMRRAWAPSSRRSSGDSIGCCGHSDAVVAMIREGFDLFVAGNHEQQAVARSKSCGCGYSSRRRREDQLRGFRARDRGAQRGVARLARHLARRADRRAGRRPRPALPRQSRLHQRVPLRGRAGRPAAGSVARPLRCPRLRLHALGTAFRAAASAAGASPSTAAWSASPITTATRPCTTRSIDLPASGEPRLEIRRVSYDHEAWARTMEAAGIAAVFVEPVRTGVWTTGVASLPRRGTIPLAARLPQARFAPKRIGSRSSWSRTPGARTLAEFRALGLVSRRKIDEALSLLDPAFPSSRAMRMADSVHLHVKVDDVDDLPSRRILALGTEAGERASGLCQVSVPGRHQPDLLLDPDRGGRSVDRSRGRQSRSSIISESICAARRASCARFRGHAGRRPARRLAAASRRAARAAGLLLPFDGRGEVLGLSAARRRPAGRGRSSSPTARSRSARR